MAAPKPGSVVALVTPLLDDKALDIPSLESILKWHVAEGTDGAVVLGTTGEASMMTMDERADIIKAAVKTVNGAFPIIVGCGGIKTSDMVDQAKQAEELGADGILVITPYYIKPPQRALVTHFHTVADACKLPMIVYNCPGRTGVGMTPETVAECAKHPNIVGVKDAVDDVVERVKPLRSLIEKDFLIYSGEDGLGCKLLQNGGDGVISVTTNVAPNAMHNMLMLAKAGDDEANTINESLGLLHSRMFLESNPIPVKRALNMMGKIGAAIRPPLCPLDPTHDEALKEALEKAKCL
jgi:4-hydroxy-tetrahydrodipicolinate synthase